MRTSSGIELFYNPNVNLQLGGMPITTSRNSYGRQKESFVADIFIMDEKLRNVGDADFETGLDRLRLDDNDDVNFDASALFSGVFIRAPGIVSIDEPETVDILATLQIGPLQFVPVALRRKNLMVTSFHPELTSDLRFHRYFVDMILENC